MSASRGDRGSGAVLALALLAAVTTAALAALALAAGLVERQRVTGAADAAALAAADAARGIVPGLPCEEADRLARANGASLARCALDGGIATVEVEGSWAGIPITARATAGPPPG